MDFTTLNIPPAVVEKRYDLIFTCTGTCAVRLEACPELNTNTFLDALRRFCSRQCHPQFFYSNNEKTFVGASEELKKTVKPLGNDIIYKDIAVANTTKNFNPPNGPAAFCGVWGAFNPECQKNAPSNSRIKKTVY